MNNTWKSVSPSEAMRHPLYGIKGWLAVFAAGNLLGILHVFGGIYRFGRESGIPMGDLIGFDHPFVKFFMFVNCLELLRIGGVLFLLATKSPIFRIFSIISSAAMLPIVLLTAASSNFNLSEVLNQIAQLVVSLLLWLAVWGTYLHRSRRVRITFENKIIEGDEFDEKHEANPLSNQPQFSQNYIVRSNNIAPKVSKSSNAGSSLEKTGNKSSDDLANSSSVDDLYAIVAEELDSGNIDKALWTRLFAECDGDETRIKVQYIRRRILKLQQDRTQTPSVNEIYSPSINDVEGDNVSDVILGRSMYYRKFMSGEVLLPNDVKNLVLLSRNCRGLIDAQDSLNKYTLLHWCGRLDLENEAEELLLLGCNPALKNAQGKQPFEIVRSTAFAKMLEIAAAKIK